MKIKQLIIPFISILFLFSSCEPFETDICQITVNEDENCTYQLSETSVPIFSFAKIKINPKPGYYVSKIDEYCRDTLNYFKSTDEEDTYYFLVEREKLTVAIRLKEKTKNSILTEIKNGKITPSKTNTFEGDTVTFTVSPDDFYYYDPSLIKVIKGHVYTSYELEEKESLEIKQSQTHPNEFSFIMPDTTATIYVPIKFGLVSVKPQKEVFAKGENIIFDVENLTPDKTFDVYLSTRASGTIIYEDIKLVDTLTLPEDLFFYRKRDKIIIDPHRNSYDKFYPGIEVPFEVELSTGEL